VTRTPLGYDVDDLPPERQGRPDAEASKYASAARGDAEASSTRGGGARDMARPRWLVRMIERWTGINAVRYWHDRHEGTLELLVQFQGEAKKQIEAGAGTLNQLTTAYKQQSAELTKTRVQLTVERNISSMLRNLIFEIGEQAAKNKEVAPRTMLGVFETICTEAIALADEWIKTGAADAAEIANVRATLANRLLSDPKPSKGPFADTLKTERKRDGRAGDTSERPRPDQLHRYEYDLFVANQFAPVNQGESCNLCHKPIRDPIHLDVHVKTSGTITVEKRPEDTPPQTLPAARHFFQRIINDDVCTKMLDFVGMIYCGRKEEDPIHIKPSEVA
jgi:hypothetical protein